MDVPETLLEFIEVEMLSRNLAYQLLQKVSPTLAPEFKRNHFPYTLEIVPGQPELWKLVDELQSTLLDADHPKPDLVA